MKDVEFEVNMPVYQSILSNATKAGITAAVEQAATDSNRHVKYDSGALHDSIHVEVTQNGLDSIGEISWHTPYALRQYYTGTPINHAKGDGSPQLKWAHYAEALYGKNWLAIMQKAFGKGMA